MLSALALAALMTASGAKGAGAAEPPPWKPALDAIAARRDALSKELSAVLEPLRARVEKERPDLLPRLGPPPKPWPTGYGILPRIDPDPPEEQNPGAPPSERTYALLQLADWVDRESRLAALIGTELSAKSRALDGLVDDYLKRKGNFELIDEHVKYHALWQSEAWRNPEQFKENNRLLELYLVWRSTDAAGKARAEEARKFLELEAAKFKKLPWHHLEPAADGSKELKLALMTDIEDEVFLSSVAAGIERVWNDAPAMRRARLKLQIVWRRRDSASLYPAGVPVRGSRLDLSDHLTRFGPGFVMTTGADSLHVLGGRGIMLGGAPTTCHVIAHEVSHLLGFADGYWRAYAGSRTGPHGVVFYEVTPFPGDILSEPGRGRVTEAMVSRLLEYGGSGR